MGHNSLRHEIWGSPRRVDFLEVHYSLTNTEINVSALQPWAEGASPGGAEQVCGILLASCGNAHLYLLFYSVPTVNPLLTPADLVNAGSAIKRLLLKRVLREQISLRMAGLRWGAVGAKEASRKSKYKVLSKSK